MIRVVNPLTIGRDHLPAERIPLGVPDDYKPCVALMKDGDLALVAFHQYELEKPRIREDIILFRSSDGGRTWSGPEELSRERGLLGREPYLTVLDDGAMLITVHLLKQDVRNKDGYVHAYVHYSNDGGRNWSTTRVEPADMPPATPACTSRNVLQLADGSVLMGVSGSRADLNSIWRSSDGGRTWPEKYPAQVAGVHGDYPFPFFGEAVLWQARSGKVYAIVRMDSRHLPPLPDRPLPDTGGSDQFDRMILYASTDTGRTWEPVGDFGDYGEMYPSVLRLGGDRLLLTFTVREMKPPLGVRAVFGVEEDDGFQFDFEHDRIMLDTKTPEGTSSGGGFGPTVRLEDGTLVTACSYRGADDRTHLEVIRWRIPDDA